MQTIKKEMDSLILNKLSSRILRSKPHTRSFKPWRFFELSHALNGVCEAKYAYTRVHMCTRHKLKADYVRKNKHFSKLIQRANRYHCVEVCIAMMLSLIFLTGTPSNRTSRAWADRVAGLRATMSYNELLICNPGCNPVCNTGGPGRCRQRSVGSSR